MPNTVIIELGERRDPAPEPARPTYPHRHRLVGLAAGVVLLTGLAGAAPRPPPDLVEARVQSRLGESMWVDDDRLFVIGPRPGRAGSGVRILTAYRLPDGRRLWQARVDTTGSEAFGLFLYRVGDALLLPQDDESGAADEVLALDQHTGEARWRRAGSLTGTTPGSAGRGGLALLSTGSGGRADAPEAITAVDPGTGRSVWTHRSPAGTSTAWSWGRRWEADRLVTGLPSGWIEIRDTTTGRMLTSANVRGPIPRATLQARQPWFAVHDRLVVVAADGGDTVTAYGLDRLDRRWTARCPEPPHRYGSAGCREVLCLQSRSSGVIGVDRRGGQVRWQRPWQFVEPVGPLVLVARRGLPGPTPFFLADPATGERVRDLGSWMIVRRGFGGEPVLYQHDVRASRAWFAVVDPAAKDARLLGVVRGGLVECRAGRGSVVCRRSDSSIGVWRYR